jgi:hypothetical protein
LADALDEVHKRTIAQGELRKWERLGGAACGERIPPAELVG